MPKSLLTISYRLDSAQRFVSSVDKNQYYFFVGNHLSSNNISWPHDNVQDSLIDAYHGMIFGKKIGSNDVSLMIRRIDWQSGKVFDSYDHDADNLYSLDFYAIVKEGSQYDVFKCLENGNGNPSTVAPSRSVVSASSEDFLYPTDGYRWKYMYSVSESVADKFANDDYFPVFVDEDVKSAAINGSIDVVSVVSPGKGYANHLTGKFSVGDVRLNGNPKRYGISVSGVKNSNGFYNGCWLYISSGSGAGQYRMIEQFTSNSTHNFVELDEAFESSNLPQNGSMFEITPSVTIKGDGRETQSARARAIIDSSGNTVSRIEMLNRGAGYNNATAEVVASATVGVTAQSVVTPVSSPYGGHGYNPMSELGCKFVGIGVALSGSEGNTVITDNDYSQIGIIKNPMFRKVTLSLTDQNKDFDANEIVYKVKTTQLAGAVQTTKSGNNLTSILNTSGVDGTSIVRSGDQIMINYEDSYQLANVVSSSETSITLDVDSAFDTGSDTANVFLVTSDCNGSVDGVSTGIIDLTNVIGVIEEGDTVIGSESGAFGTVDGVKITDVDKSFNTFLQAHTYIGSMVQGEFTSDEEVYQVGDDVSTAVFHSIVDDTATGTKRIYVTRQHGVFNTSSDSANMSSEINGSTSGAIAELTNKYLPDLVFGSGDIMFIENDEAVTRSSEKTEIYKLVLQF